MIDLGKDISNPVAHLVWGSVRSSLVNSVSHCTKLHDTLGRSVRSSVLSSISASIERGLYD